MRFTAKALLRSFALLLCLAMALPLGALAPAAAPATDGNFQAEFPKAAYFPNLEKNNRAKLLWLDEQKFTLSLSRVTTEGEPWVRALLTTEDDTFIAAVLLGSLESLGEEEKLRIDFVRSRKNDATTIAFTALPAERLVATMQFPKIFEGEASLTGTAFNDGARLLFTDQPAAATPTPTPGTTTVHSGAADEAQPRGRALYFVLALILILLLAALVCATLFRKQVAEFAAPLRAKAAPSLAKGKARLQETSRHVATRTKALAAAAAAKSGPALRSLRQKLRPVAAERDKASASDMQAQAGKPEQPARAVAAAAPGATQRIPPQREFMEPAAEPASGRVAISSLAGVELIPAASAGSLVQTVSMDGLLPAADEVASDETPDETAILNAFFAGKRQSVPPGLGFVTVGLRNRDALLGVMPGPNAPAPLFAPNPRGQVFSLSAAGNLFLHIDYFAPPSFVAHSVLSNVCLEHTFLLENERGDILDAAEVRNRKILAIIPARTRKTEEGYYEVVEKGRLLIGAI